MFLAPDLEKFDAGLIAQEVVQHETMKGTNRISIKIVLLLTLIAAVTSCKIMQPYQRPSDIANGQLYRDVTTSDTTTIANIPWQQLFTDPQLQALLQEGMANNLDLKIAVARIRQAEANYNQARAAFLPTLNASVGATQQKANATKGVPSTVYDVAASAGWEADLWGRLRSTRRSYLASLLQSEAYRRAVQTQLIANIANSYYQLLAYDQQLRITEQTVALRREEVATMQTLKESDVVTGAAVVQSQANRYSAEVTIPDIKMAIRETENALSTLLGRAPGPIARSTLDSQTVKADLRTGVPAQLLANRPDVQQAEYQLRAAFELTNAARAYFYPSLSITAQGGFSAASLSKLFNPAAFFGSIAEGLTEPIFNQGLNRRRLQIAQAQQEEYLTTFRQTLLSAGEEVSNALYSYQAATDKIGSRTQQIAFLQKAVDYTQQLLKYSSATNYTDVLTSEQSLLTAELNSINDRLQQLQAVVSLYRSLGGGWR
jgi:outer membrane protein, multidrug efflux system